MYHTPFRKFSFHRGVFLFFRFIRLRRQHLCADRGCPPEFFLETQEGRTPLHWAAREGHVAVVEQLLAARAEKDTVDQVSGEG